MWVLRTKKYASFEATQVCGDSCCFELCMYCYIIGFGFWFFLGFECWNSWFPSQGLGFWLYHILGYQYKTLPMATCDMESQHHQEQDQFSPIRQGFMQKFRLYQTLSVIIHFLIAGDQRVYLKVCRKYLKTVQKLTAQSNCIAQVRISCGGLITWFS